MRNFYSWPKYVKESVSKCTKHLLDLFLNIPQQPGTRIQKILPTRLKRCKKDQDQDAWQHLLMLLLHTAYMLLCNLFNLFKLPRGGIHIFGRTRMCRSNGSLFYKKSLNMGPILYHKILKHGSTFLTEPKFSGFRMVKTPKNHEIFEIRPIFQEKSLNMGTLFCQNHP